MPRAGLSCKGKALSSYNLSVCFADSSPSRGASGETVHFAGTAKASPFGRGGSATGVTERASPARKSRRAAIGRLFVGAILSQCRAVWKHPCPLSRAYARQLPQRGSHWHVGQLSSGRAKHDVSETVVLRCLGQRQLDKERLSRSCCPL